MPRTSVLSRDNLAVAIVLRAAGFPYGQIAKILNVGKTTVFRALEEYSDQDIALAIEEFLNFLENTKKGRIGIIERLNNIEERLKKLEEEITKLKPL